MRIGAAILASALLALSSRVVARYPLRGLSEADEGFARVGTVPDGMAAMWRGTSETSVKAWDMAGVVAPNGQFLWLAKDDNGNSDTWLGEYTSWEPACNEDAPNKKKKKKKESTCEYKAVAVQHITNPDGTKRDVVACEVGSISANGKHWDFYGNWRDSSHCPDTPEDADYVGSLVHAGHYHNVIDEHVLTAFIKELVHGDQQ